jgi:hypothetical protein
VLRLPIGDTGLSTIGSWLGWAGCRGIVVRCDGLPVVPDLGRVGSLLMDRHRHLNPGPAWTIESPIAPPIAVAPARLGVGSMCNGRDDTGDDSEVRDGTWTILLVLCAIAIVLFVCLVIMFGGRMR